MSSFASKNLFASADHGFHVHGASQRLAEHDQPGVNGTRLTGLGRSARRIEQTGLLIADDLASLQQQLDAIEAMVDGAAYTLVDHLGRSYPNVMMVRFEPGPIERLGSRLAVGYHIDYQQVRS
jgi:hypothetical protein